MIYTIKRRDPRGRTKILQTYNAHSLQDAKIRFTDFLADHLAHTPGIRFVSFLPTADGCCIPEDIADPSPADILPDPPAWYLGEGFYDAKNVLILRYENPRIGTHLDIDNFSFSGSLFFLDSERLWTSIEVCQAMRVTRQTLLRWVKRGQITPLHQADKPTTRKHIFTDAEVTRLMSASPPFTRLAKK
jgi:hypothetical protein